MLLAGADAAWRAMVLSGPLAAASEAGIELSDSERAILGSIPGPALGQMIDSMARKHGRSALGKAAAGVAAAALLATGLTGCGDDASMGGRFGPPRPRAGKAGAAILPDIRLRPLDDARSFVNGIRPDAPDEAPIMREESLEAVLKIAAEKGSAAMVLLEPAGGGRGAKLDADEADKSRDMLERFCPDYRRSVKKHGLLLAALSRPEPPSQDAGPDEKAKRDALIKAWDAAMKKYDVASFPAVVFLASDGSELAGKLVRPAEVGPVLKAIESASAELARRKAAQEKPAAGS